MSRILLRLAIVYLALFAIVGCGPATIDCSSTDRIKSTVQAVRQPLSNVQKQAFDTAIFSMAMEEIDVSDESASLSFDLYGAVERVGDRIHGMTAQEVIDSGRTKQTEQKSIQKEEVLTRLKALETKKEEALRAVDKLAAIEIEDHQLTWVKSEGQPKTSPLLLLTLRNNSEYSIGRFYFDVAVTAPRRSKPWVKMQFFTDAEKGLGPGVRDRWRIPLGVGDDWDKVPRSRSDLIADLRLTRIDDVNGRVIIDANFSDSDEENLQRLRDSHEKLRF